jgi:hypothetical protein
MIWAGRVFTAFVRARLGHVLVRYARLECDELGRYQIAVGAGDHVGELRHEVGRQDQLAGDIGAVWRFNTGDGKNWPPVRTDDVYALKLFAENINRLVY